MYDMSEDNSENKSAEQGRVGFSILYQILLTMCLITLIPLGGLWFISIDKAREDWTDHIFQNLVRNTESLTRSVDDWASMNMHFLEQNARTPAIASMDSERQLPVLKSMAGSYEWVYLAFTFLPNGENIARSKGKPRKNYSDRQYFKQALSGKQLGQQLLIGNTSGKPSLILAKPVRDGSQVLGVIAIGMTLDALSKTITKTKIGRTGYAILLDDKNRLIAHGQGKVTSELQDYGFHPSLASRGNIEKDSFVFNEYGKQIVAYTQKTRQGWTLIVQQDYDEAYSAANIAQENAMIILVLTFVTVLIIAILLARRLSTPIRRLTSIAAEISRGKLGAEIRETERNDEIGALARAIERMGVSLQMALQRLRKK